MKTEELSYSGKDGENEFSGTVTVQEPETVQEAIQAYGEDVCLSKIIQAVTIDRQRVCRTFKGDNEKAQIGMDQFKPGVSRPRTGGGSSLSAVQKMLKELPKEERERILANIMAAAGVQQ